jgi:hypothetical protein
VQNGRVKFASGTGTVEAMVLCDDGFVSPPGPALCRTRVTPTREVGVEALKKACRVHALINKDSLKVIV